MTIASASECVAMSDILGFTFVVNLTILSRGVLPFVILTVLFLLKGYRAQRALAFEKAICNSSYLYCFKYAIDTGDFYATVPTAVALLWSCDHHLICNIPLHLSSLLPSAGKILRPKGRCRLKPLVCIPLVLGALSLGY